MNQILIFLQKPNQKSFVFDLETKVRFAFYGWFYCYFFTFLSIILLSVFVKLTSIVGINVSFDTLMNLRPKPKVNNYLVTLLITPILEEICFRLYLIPKKWNFIFSTIIWLGVLGRILFNKSFLDFQEIVVISIGVIFIFIVIYDKLQVIIYENFKFVYYFSSLFFGCFHLITFIPLSWNYCLFYPFLILPQIIAGLILGYIRIVLENGIIWSILIHIFINLPAVIYSMY